MDQTPKLVGESKPTKATKFGKIKGKWIIMIITTCIFTGLAHIGYYMLWCTSTPRPTAKDIEKPQQKTSTPRP